jgi:UDP-hydrolysing UDP-N-acetyl-D-glucosamine 2-epimerase
VRRIAVVSVARSDYGLYLPLLRQIVERPELTLLVIAAAAHLRPEYGLTIERIAADGFEIAWRVEMGRTDQSRLDAARAMAGGTRGFTEAYSALEPDLVVLLGDRLEMHAAAVAAVPLGIPLAHLYGGDLTFGAIDDALRHSITKLSHLHFAATAQSASRIVQMGEEPWRVAFTGALSVDNARLLPRPRAAELRAKYGLADRRTFLLVTLHPATLDGSDAADQARTLVEALSGIGHDVLCTQPNADPGSVIIDAELRKWSQTGGSAVRYVANLGPNDFIAAMENAAAMVGNSSAGIIEARHYGLPVVNIGDRQAGRERGANVIDVPCSVGAIRNAVHRATEPEFRRTFEREPNPYGDGRAAERMVERLIEAPARDILLRKKFVDTPKPQAWELSSVG